MLVALTVLLLAFTGPPRAYVDTGAAHVPLAISSWCWGARCGAPIAASRRVAYVARGTRVRIELAFLPTDARVAIGGTPVIVLRHGHELSWRARRAGGITVTATGVHGWVTYVGRLALR